MNRLIMGMVMVAMLMAFSAPASATCPCVTIDTGTIDGNIYYKAANVWPGTGGGGNYVASTTFANVPAGVKTARVHTGVWMLDPGSVNITVNGVASGPKTATGCTCNSINTPKMHSYCTGYGPHFITYDATADIPAGGGNIPVTVESTNAGDGRIYTIALLVVYEDGSTSMTYWINEGAWYTAAGPAVADFIGPYPTGVTDVTYWTLGLPHGISSNPLLNTNNIGPPTWCMGDSYDFCRWDHISTTYLAVPNNQMVHPVSGGAYERLDAAVFRLWRGPIAQPDLNGWDIIFPDEMEPSTSYPIDVMVKNQGNAGTGETFNVSLWIDGVFHSKVIGVGPLGPGASILVNFPNVNLPECCHNFTVIKDCDNDVVESDETNNVITEWHTVGHNHTVVRNNTQLTDHDDFRLENSIYYLENLTIWNCAGCGITIENTTLPFVIANCTVQNCGYNSGVLITLCSGICLKNVTNGTVRDSVVVHNTEHGISVLDYSTHVNITNCTICDHSAGYGIEVGLVTLSGSEIPKFINITCNELYDNLYGIDLIGTDCTAKGNTVRDNGAYGIYVFGNDSKIYNNTIENNDDYGMKMYNSSGNYIYWNDIINNNGVGVQGWDNRLTNTWNTPTQVNYPYGCTIYTNYTGNYWDDHTSPDANGDGIVDIPYELDGGSAKDYYPLTVRWRLCGDVNRDGGVNFGDMGKIRRCIVFQEQPCNPCAMDVDCNGDVNFGDMGKVRRHIVFGEPLNCCCEPLECPSCS